MVRLSRQVYDFAEGNAKMRELLGGKGANLAEMTSIGLPVPPGFTITTEACNIYQSEKCLSPGLIKEVEEHLQRLQQKTSKVFGSGDNPLLVSVRSGAAISMPGMMDTILNLGLNDKTVEALARQSNNRRFALDCYRRFIQMFAEVVLKVDHYLFERLLEQVKTEYQAASDMELEPQALEKVIDSYFVIIKDQGKTFPQDPWKQLLMSIEAVFSSWNNQRAIVYRRLNKIPDSLGTAVNIQSMVFGNFGNDSGTGVAFTRNPSTGEKELYGEFLLNAQGEDVVAGIRTPLPISQLNRTMPQVYEEFASIASLLEKHYRDMQDIEFTIERGKLYLLQTRAGKRSAAAAVKIAVDMVKEDIITEEEALLKVEPKQLDQLLHPRIDPEAELEALATGLPASPGAATGKVVFDADEAEKMGSAGEKVILVRPETTPDDIHGIVASQGVLTSRGGMTSHAAVVARGMGKPCICGAESIKIDIDKKTFSVEGVLVAQGDIISLDGSTGKIFKGEAPLISPQLSGELNELLAWADKKRVLSVRANADNPQDAAKARSFGAEGIGLCRTEHMFMGHDRLALVQKMILAETKENRDKALQKLLPLQRDDFIGIFREMKGLPTTIRLLDPPLHEFLPNLEELLVEIAVMKEKGESGQKLQQKHFLLKKVKSLAEFNPMLGHRGCRLGLVFPEIYAVQVRAIFQAAAKVMKEGIQVKPEIMIPLVGHYRELEKLKALVDKEAKAVQEEEGINFTYSVGTMIELPRACLTADKIAESAEFFSFGTNDLTQTTFGFSRDDAEGKFLPFYLQQKILPDNPFMVLDREGVGKIMKMGVELGRKTKPDIKLGICGEHGGDPSSIAFCHELGLDYVSCSPFRVPIARLAAAQAAIRHKN